ncbi:hypothetical protein, partial [Pseudomonas savastanoi]
MFKAVSTENLSLNKKSVPGDAFSVELNLQVRLVPGSSLLVLFVIVVVLECWLHAWLRRVFSVGRDFEPPRVSRRPFCLSHATWADSVS